MHWQPYFPISPGESSQKYFDRRKSWLFGGSKTYVLHGLLWVEAKFTAEEKDAGAVVEEGAEAARVGFDRLDL